MRFAISSTLALIGLLGATSTAQTVPSSQCHPKGAVHAIIVRGESRPGDGDPSPINVLTTTKAEIEKQMPGSSVIGLPYDYFNSDKFAAINSGSTMLKDYIAKYVASCPNARIMVVGYSLGGVAVMDTACGTSTAGLMPTLQLNQKYAKNMVGIIVWGEETHFPYQPWNVGTCPQGMGYLPRANNVFCNTFSRSLRSYCDLKDSQCCGFWPPNVNEGHFGYHKYNPEFVAFAKKNMEASNR